MSLVAVPSTMFQLPTLKRSRDDEDDLMDSSVDHKVRVRGVVLVV